MNSTQMITSMSDAEQVKEFTKESGADVSNKPNLMSKDEVFFLIKMMLDEIMELGATVAHSHEVKTEMMKMILNSKDLPLINQSAILQNYKYQDKFEKMQREKGQLGEEEDWTYMTQEFSDWTLQTVIAEQADALIDCYYYSLNAAAKKGVNLSKIFQVVHKANMDKRDPVTGKFLRREDGKIIKPKGWMEPDITAEIIRQGNEGSFN